MKNKLLIALSAFVLVGLSACTPQATVELSTAESQKKFLEDVIEVMDSVSDYVMTGTITSKINEEKSFEMDLEMKVKEDNSLGTISTGENSMTSLLIDERSFYSNDGTTWFEIISEEGSGSVIDTEQFSDVSKIVDPEKYTYKGVQDCGDGQRCQVYEFEKEEGKYTAYFTGDMKVKRFTITSEEASGDLNYKYETVNLPGIPANAQKLEGIQGAFKILELYTPLLEEAGVDPSDLQ